MWCRRGGGTEGETEEGRKGRDEGTAIEIERVTRGGLGTQTHRLLYVCISVC
jgi:hypothetical protein